MSLKIKLASTITAFLLVLALMIGNVFAAPNANVQLGGSLGFNATGVYAKVTGVIAGAKAETQPTLPVLEFGVGLNPSVSDWADIPLTFTDAGDEITITVTIENLATDRPLYASITDAVGEVENVTKSMKKGSEKYAGEVLTLPASTGAGSSTVVIILSLKVTDPNESIAADAKYGYNIDLGNEELTTTDAYWANYGIKFEPETSIADDVAGVSSVTINENETMPRVKIVADFDNIDKFKELNGVLNVPAYVNIINEDGSKTKSVITQIGSYAFCDYPGLSSGKYGEDMEVAMASAIASLTSITLPNTIESIGAFAFGDSSITSIDLPKGVTEIGMCAFGGCSITSIDLPDSVKTIGMGAFVESALKVVSLPNSLESLGDVIFSGCALENIVINCKTIPNYLFGQSGDSAIIQNLTIGKDVKTVSAASLEGLSKITNLIIEDINAFAQIEYIIETAPCNPMILAENIYLASDLENTLTHVEITATKISDSALMGNKFQSVTLSDNVKTIGVNAFWGSSELTSVTIGNGVTTIGDYAFSTCGKLTTITINATAVPTLGEEALPSNLTEIRVPAASLELYQKAENWSAYSSIMVGI